MQKKDEYVREIKVLEKTDRQRDEEIIESLVKTKMELEIANRNYEHAEEELIDYYSYQIKANKAKLDYLLKRAKNQKLVLNMIDAIGFQIVDAG